jgi:alpha-beta hydrolase superfamily lysophospholipase
MNQTAYEILKMISLCKEEIPNMNVPMYIIHGTADTIALPKGSQYLYDNVATTEADKTLTMYPQLKHEVFHERKPDGPAAIKNIVNYIESMVTHPMTHFNIDIVSKE